MNNRTLILFLFFVLLLPFAQGKRRKKIVEKYNFEPTPLLMAQNKKPIKEPEEKEELEETEELEEPEEEEAEEKEELEEDEEELEEAEEEAPKPVVKKPTVKPKKVAVKEKVKEEPLEEEKPEKDIYLNFENADLKTFVDYIGRLKKINVVTDPKISGNKISVSIRDPLTIEGAWKVFLTILEMSGFSIIHVGDLHKVIQNKQKFTEPLPTYIRTPAEKLPDSDITIRYVTFLNNIRIEQVSSLLKSMLSRSSKIIPHKNANGLVITDKSYNIKSAMKVIAELDRSDVKQAVTVMRLKRANAKDVQDLFKGLMHKKPAASPLARLLGRQAETSVEYFPPTTRIITEPRTNSLILLGDQKSIKRIEDFIVEHVDKELKGIKSPIHIYELKHTDADQIKSVLEAITESNATSPAAKYGGIRGGVKYFKKMKFGIDKANNRLIVSSTDED
jgi:general secretion pathway protein D